MVRVLISEKYKSTAMRLGVVLLAVFSFWRITQAAECGEFDSLVKKREMYVPGADSERQVAGNGRLQFYSAPDVKCKMAGVFILPHQKIDAYYTYGYYTSVVYIDVKTGSNVSGWVRSNRLKSTGLGIAPRH
ncbi:hypothetical protein [Paraburkholderia diazotrophica]|uniref:hypothetical protein n=1 Tax=Paraburkholderia diazotrophica TaxID=667676 RepID=UPI00115FDD07|nr:hypothetical protein [Paraburkholderia diazotrophica]